MVCKNVKRTTLSPNIIKELKERKDGGGGQIYDFWLYCILLLNSRGVSGQLTTYFLLSLAVPSCKCSNQFRPMKWDLLNIVLNHV